MKINIRSEHSGDEAAITRVNDLAFKQPKEGILIEKLREKHGFEKELSIVAELDEEIIGHILFFPIHVREKNDLYLTLSLAPLAVIPEYQRKGIGQQLIHEGHQRAKELGFTSVLVVGHPDYYPKTGYSKASGFEILCPVPAPDEAFMAIELMDGALNEVSGTAVFPEEYGEV